MIASRLARTCLPVFAASLLTLPLLSPAQQPAKTEILQKARQSYYSLKAEGLGQVACSMAPDWNYLLEEQRKTDPASIDAAIKKLEGLRFMLALDSEGVATVTHNDLPAENEQVAAGLKQIYSGMEQMATGFFQTWSAYTMVPALPDLGSDFKLESTPVDYRLSYQDGSADVSTTLGKDFAITAQAVKTAGFDAALQLQFKKLSKGLILSAYDATYRGKTPAENTLLSVSIEYQEVNGLQFPREITLSGSYGSNPFRAKLAFANCQLAKK